MARQAGACRSTQGCKEPSPPSRRRLVDERGGTVHHERHGNMASRMLPAQKRSQVVPGAAHAGTAKWSGDDYQTTAGVDVVSDAVLMRALFSRTRPPQIQVRIIEEEAWCRSGNPTLRSTSTPCLWQAIASDVEVYFSSSVRPAPRIAECGAPCGDKQCYIRHAALAV